MSALRDFQQSLQAAILAGPGEPPDGLCEDGRIPAAAGLAVYRNTVFSQLTRALGDLYPVVVQLVGDGFFAYAAHRYIREQLPRSPVLADYGDTFPDFLDRFEPARTVPCLGAVARLEYARHRALNAPEASPLTAASLSTIPPDRLGELRLRLHPSARLVRSDFPVDAIWQAHQHASGLDDLAELEPISTHLLVARPLASVEMLALSDDAHGFVTGLAADASLAEAANASTGHWDVQAALTELLLFGAFVAFSLPEEMSY